MSIERLVVGHRHGSRKIQKLADDFGIHCVAVRKCIAGCGYPVYFASGGIDAARDKDAEVICEECKAEFYADIVAEL